jgi:hypothetical protein
MIRRFRWLSTVSACTLIVALSLGPAVAADKARLDDATKQVKGGAQSIGYGEFGAGFADLFTGIGRTIVEGTVYTGKTIGEFFKKTFGGD